MEPYTHDTLSAFYFSDIGITSFTNLQVLGQIVDPDTLSDHSKTDGTFDDL